MVSTALLHAWRASNSLGDENAALLPEAFLHDYFDGLDADRMGERNAEALLQIAQRHWQLALSSAAGAKVSVLPPTPDCPCTRVTTVVPDMPFLLDTVLGAVRAQGGIVDWVAHPILSINRYTNPQSNSGSSPLSLIHIECEPLKQPSDYQALEQTLIATVADLTLAVADYRAMRDRVLALATALADSPPDQNGERSEAAAFLRWLMDGQFTLLGIAESAVEQAEDARMHLKPLPEKAFGLARQDCVWADETAWIAPQLELDKYAESTRVVVITKGNVRSHIQHNELIDVISIKHVDAQGAILGTARVIGLLDEAAYRSSATEIPVLRKKIADVLGRAAFTPDSHSEKALLDTLASWPRDELFQSSEDELFIAAMSLLMLRDRLQLKLLIRRDRYGRFFSCLVHMPRERYSRELREAIVKHLLQSFSGTYADKEVDFLRNGLTRLHVTVQTPPGTTSSLSTAEIEAQLIAATRSWRERLRDALQGNPDMQARFVDAFAAADYDQLAPEAAAADVQRLAQLTESQRIDASLVVNDESVIVGLKLYCWGEPVALARVLPLLESFGLIVAGQRSLVLAAPSPASHHLVLLNLEPRPLPQASARLRQQHFETALTQSLNDGAERDHYAQLILAAGISPRQLTLVRAIGGYLIQTSLPFGPSYTQEIFAQHSDWVAALLAWFEAKFDPSLLETRSLTLANREPVVLALLDQAKSLDADRIMRAATQWVAAATRSNYFQRDAEGNPKAYLSVKLNPHEITELPLPKPMFEVWVYADAFEGIHLRGGKVARGGLRWSDRRQDFRTEVLGLMKAQTVKNTVIVPVGAKGGFVVKKATSPDREAWQAIGIACYQNFLRGLLDLTDNRQGDRIVPPPLCVCYDEPDPYLVVAADKGTATFSDIANQISAEYGHWLGDAFASGGSVGYDHKKMGITAKGAWESVKRHFRECGRDIQSQAFTVVGIGDMSGDVFGNGMLLSPEIRLIAAFDHRHIFIDPNPDPAMSFAERARLFALPRSSWADYQPERISEGGGVYPRSTKSVYLPPSAQAALGVTVDKMTPQELIRSILTAPVDLLWNGGIGTYVKASSQSHQDVGDRANDGIRVNGRDLRCAVVGEGGNLGCTQLGRVEYALAGGRINTDAIDNAGGVHSSDREVNIKIPLNAMLLVGTLTREQRDPLLARMTDDLARAVLCDNTVQSLAVSMLQAHAAQRLDEHIEMMKVLEREGLLNRSVEFLPDDEVLKERQRQGLGLTRPELSVLLAYTKMSLYQATLNSSMPDDRFFARDLLAYFPTELVQRYPDALRSHQLAREIIATILSNAVANRMGLSFAHRMANDHGHSRAHVLKAYATAHEVFAGDAYWQAIEALDGVVPSTVQFKLLAMVTGLLKHVTGWLLMSGYVLRSVGYAVDRLAKGVQFIESCLPEQLPPSYRRDWQRSFDQLRADAVPEALALRLAAVKFLGTAPDVIEIADAGRVEWADALTVYLAVGEQLGFLRLYEAINHLDVRGKWHALARQNLRDDLFHTHRLISINALQGHGSPLQRMKSWFAINDGKVGFATMRIDALHEYPKLDFEALAVAVRELRKLHLP